MLWKYLSDKDRVTLIGKIIRNHLHNGVSLTNACKGAGIPVTSFPMYVRIVREIVSKNPSYLEGLSEEVINYIKTKY